MEEELAQRDHEPQESFKAREQNLKRPEAVEHGAAAQEEGYSRPKRCSTGQRFNPDRINRVSRLVREEFYRLSSGVPVSSLVLLVGTRRN